MNNPAGKLKRPSRAPEPIKPLNPPLLLPPPDPIPEPEWSRWSHMRTMRLWQAVALLVSLSPEHLPVYEAANLLGMDPFRISPPEFRGLLEIAASDAGRSFPVEVNGAFPTAAFGLVDAVELGAWALKSGVVASLPPMYPSAANAAVAAASETPTERRGRRLAEFASLGGEMVPAGKSWHTRGKVGALARLAESEKAAGKPMSDRADVRRELIKAMEEKRGS